MDKRLRFNSAAYFFTVENDGEEFPKVEPARFLFPLVLILLKQKFVTTRNSISILRETPKLVCFTRPEQSNKAHETLR